MLGKGPGDLLEVDVSNATCMVKWQSIPYMVPIRHVRPHAIVHDSSMHTAAYGHDDLTPTMLDGQIASSMDLGAPQYHSMVFAFGVGCTQCALDG